MTRARFALPIAIAAWAAIAGTASTVTGAHLPADDWRKVTAGYRGSLGQKPKETVKILAIGRLV
ncbi:hypothetical protein [Allomesorhizobium camelthorni]|uniref:Uncharacterized protein n=1 Tax=Allomesorhizobium camelthorni TaxID=475069 RepID=A0A6G4WC12_9HYPH|nr:hypothetical protein [Mesorhizobium camelthorni]NGO52335.1 hypothetical protein [Mesorhizobium camelthorni]